MLHWKYFITKDLIIPIILEKVTYWYVVMVLNMNSNDLYFYPMLPQLSKSFSVVVMISQ